MVHDEETERKMNEMVINGSSYARINKSDDIDSVESEVRPG